MRVRFRMVVVLVAYFTVLFAFITTHSSDFRSEQQKGYTQVATVASNVAARFENLVSEYLFVRTQLRGYFTGSHTDASIETTLTNFVSLSDLIFKARLINASGFESILAGADLNGAVDANGARVVSFTLNSMADKSHRYFFTDSVGKSLFVSNLDLNQESGIGIWVPWYKTIRLGGEIFPGSGTTNVVVLNFRVNEILDDYVVSTTNSEVFLIDQYGYCLHGCPEDQLYLNNFGKPRQANFVPGDMALEMMKPEKLHIMTEQIRIETTFYTIQRLSAQAMCTVALLNCELSYRQWFIVDKRSVSSIL